MTTCNCHFCIRKAGCADRGSKRCPWPVQLTVETRIPPSLPSRLALDCTEQTAPNDPDDISTETTRSSMGPSSTHSPSLAVPLKAALPASRLQRASCAFAFVCLFLWQGRSSQAPPDPLDASCLSQAPSLCRSATCSSMCARLSIGSGLSTCYRAGDIRRVCQVTGPSGESQRIATPALAANLSPLCL